jgi:hypothetical protein
MTQRTRIALIIGVAVVLLGFVAVLARISPPVVALKDGAYTVAAAPGTKLSLDVNSGAVEVVAGDKPELRIDYLGDPDMAPEIRMRATESTITVGVHGLKQRSKVIITVPKNTNLNASLGAGQLIIKDVVGDKDLTVYAGQIIVSGDVKQYGWADAKVLAGRFSAAPMNIDKSGVFRWGTWSGPGKSSLSMTLLSGEAVVRD